MSTRYGKPPPGPADCLWIRNTPPLVSSEKIDPGARAESALATRTAGYRGRWKGDEYPAAGQVEMDVVHLAKIMRRGQSCKVVAGSEQFR